MYSVFYKKRDERGRISSYSRPFKTRIGAKLFIAQLKLDKKVSGIREIVA